MYEHASSNVSTSSHRVQNRCPSCFSGCNISAYKISSHILIVPDDVTIRDSSAQCVITYGLSPKNSVTLSSTDNNKYTLAIQRDIISLGGSIVLRQEFSLDSILSQYETMALASLLAISDLLEQ